MSPALTHRGHADRPSVTTNQRRLSHRRGGTGTAMGIEKGVWPEAELTARPDPAAGAPAPSEAPRAGAGGGAGGAPGRVGGGRGAAGGIDGAGFRFRRKKRAGTIATTIAPMTATSQPHSSRKVSRRHRACTDFGPSITIVIVVDVPSASPIHPVNT